MKTQIPDYLSDFQARQAGIAFVNELGLKKNGAAPGFYVLPEGTFSLEGIGRRFHRLIQDAIESGDAHHHITGNYPTREITHREGKERREQTYKVKFGSITIHVYGDGLSDADAEEAAQHWLAKQGIPHIGPADGVWDITPAIKVHEESPNKTNKMALYATQSNGIESTERTYHLGDHRLMIEELLEEQNMNLVSVSADGDELEFIRRNFTGIPMRNFTYHLVTWTGETARFIVENW